MALTEATRNTPVHPLDIYGSTLPGRLEALVDATYLRAVIEALEHVCYEKAEHLRSNWQDERTARYWETVGKALDRAAAKA